MKVIVEKTVCVLGDYELKFPLDCDSDVMGKEFKIRLDKVKLAPQIIW